MTKKSTYLLGILLTILVGTLLYWKFCCNCCCKKTIAQDATAVVSDIPNSGNNSFRWNGKDMNYQCMDNFRFTKDGFVKLMPVGDSVNNGIDLLKTNLDKNANQNLKITGYYTKDEKNTSAFPNLGIARANDVKNYLVSKGISASRIDLNGEERPTWAMQGDTLLGPVDFQISQQEKVDTKEDWNALKEKINANPLVLYFNTNQSEINLSAEERQKVADIVKYLDHVTDAKVSAVGHTDNVGDRAKNIQLGQNRADFAKQYLSKNGIAENKIVSSSKGPDAPIADNATAEGKAKNRRTVVTIQ